MADSNIVLPYFHLCPDLNSFAPPNGQLKLGTMLRDLSIENVMFPFDAGKAIEVPDLQLWPLDGAFEIGGFTRTLEELGEGNMLEVIAGNDMGSKPDRVQFLENKNKILKVEKLNGQCFIPTPEYIDKALEMDGVASYIESTERKRPVYMITGLMWTEGDAKLVDKRGKDGFTRDSSHPFIVGIRVRKMWWRKNGTRYESKDELDATSDPNHLKVCWSQ
ncbi:hypothetical protein HDV63DRAFT_403703 [Trichoderma sp. SZMC 28014]